MKQNLRHYFPIIKTRDEILNIINNDFFLKNTFSNWLPEQQNEFLDFCSGAKGVKILYDSFFKEVFNPEYNPERLSDMISAILGTKVKIIKILPIDSTRLGNETSLIIMDIVAELEDGSIINVEVQKIGYMFPGERSACYSSDLLLRQYKRIRDKTRSSRFSYKLIKPVYTIVFFEQSPACFEAFPDEFIHIFNQSSDTGLEMELLQKYVFIPLDIFRKKHNNIDTELDAWLTFLSSDDVSDIIQLIEKYPKFKPLYETMYNMCQNVEGVMSMFSKELYELDRGTELLMVDELQKEVNEKKAELAKLTQKISENQKALDENQKALGESQKALDESQKALIEKDAIIASLEAQLKKN